MDDLVLNQHNIDKGKEIVKELIEKFESKKAYYTSNKFKEEEAKMDFINPFFEALGWDVYNKQNKGPTSKDVKFEPKLKIGDENRAPDYAFRLGGQLIYYLEAKKPNVNIRDNRDPANQAKRYGWSAKTPIVVLTDFEELSIYESTSKPQKQDNARKYRLRYYTYEDYLDNWEEIYGILSKEAVKTGLFQNFIDKNVNIGPNTQSIDKEFLKDIEKWRLLLARNIALRNKELSLSELNLAVQLIIDRIVFLRMAEDRGIERRGTLKRLTESENIYKKLCELFKKADEIYNSGLFHFNNSSGDSEFVDNITLDLNIDDIVFKKIFRDLYYPYSPYEFSVISPEILGNVYESFLGSIIRLTPNHQAKIEQKHEVKKAGGVYYTPQYIANHIVENTVGELIKNKKPEEISNLKIVDPACGSGSFLLRAYQKLLDYHLEYYISHKDIPDNVHYVGKDEEPRLTIREKKRILMNNIYGVDIDVNAVEVTKLSLLLKVLEDENKDELEQQKTLFNEKALPNLSNNIKCGNSLINFDIDEIHNLNDEQRFKINPFDWTIEFPHVFDKGGFDVVIGNTPYIRVQEMDNLSIEYFNREFSDIAAGNYDEYILFIKKGFDLLNKNGKFGFIVPNKFFTSEYGFKIRKFLEKNHAIDNIVDFTSNQIFSNATTYTCLLYLSKEKNETFLYKKYDLGDNFNKINFDDALEFNKNIFIDSDFWMFTSNDVQNVLDKINNQPIILNDISKISKGSSTGVDKFFLLDFEDEDDNFIYGSSKLKNNIKIEKELMKPFVHGKDIKRYELIKPTKYLFFPYFEEDNEFYLIPVNLLKNKYPHAYEYISEFKGELKSRKIKTDNKDYYRYSAARNLPTYGSKKIMIPDLLVSNRIGFDFDSKMFHGAAIHNILFNDKITEEMEVIILGILNSNLFWFFISNTSTSMSGNAFRLTPMYLKQFKLPDFNLIEKGLLLKLHDLVLKIFELNLKSSKCKTSVESNSFKKQAQIVDFKINSLIYELYELTDEEIEIIESKT